ncbi:MAG: helix-turn-helix domain-containing protein [Thermodesulfobacteriota bacterium]
MKIKPVAIFIPSLVRERRVALGLRQAELAERAGVSETTVVLMENGRKEPKVNTLAKVAAALCEGPGFFFAFGA